MANCIRESHSAVKNLICRCLQILSLQTAGIREISLGVQVNEQNSASSVHERVGQLMDTVANMVLRAGIDVDLRARFELPGEDEPQAGNGAE